MRDIHWKAIKVVRTAAVDIIKIILKTKIIRVSQMINKVLIVIISGILLRINKSYFIEVIKRLIILK
jgi:hypothetical protein